MTVRTTTRGRPLIALFLLLVAWVGARAALWDGPQVLPLMPEQTLFVEYSAEDADRLALAKPPAFVRREFGPQSVPSAAYGPPQAIQQPYHAERRAYAPPVNDVRRWIEPRPLAAQPRAAQPNPAEPRAAKQRGSFLAGIMPFSFFGMGASGPSQPVSPSGPAKVPVRIAVAHHMAWMSALARMPIPMGLLSAPDYSPSPAFYAADRSASPGKRWSGDSWLLWRRGGQATLATGAAPATYGASQAGGVLRYRLGLNNGHKPTAYLRATAALNGSQEKEAALGFSARPIPSVPLIAAAEMRATDQNGTTRFRPAAMVVTELTPVYLPFGTRAEIYGQAGYVGGRFSTPFADGQIRIDKKLADVGRGELRAGAGSWAGAQRGASRVDVGPTATIGVQLGGSASARLGVDWRFRAAGRAEPRSGPAVTLSAGF